MWIDLPIGLPLSLRRLMDQPIFDCLLGGPYGAYAVSNEEFLRSADFIQKAEILKAIRSRSSISRMRTAKSFKI